MLIILSFDMRRFNSNTVLGYGGFELDSKQTVIFIGYLVDRPWSCYVGT